MIGRVLGGYRLEEELGSGAFGTVYRARHVDMDWVMAVKVARERHFGEMIREEGRLLARLWHPNVVRVQHMETSGDTPFVVVEYVDGESLTQTLQRGAMNPERVLELARQLLAGLAAAHELGILHRDIKPGNVLIAQDGTAKLADFGLGRVVERRLAQSVSDGSLTAFLTRSQVSRKDASGGGEIVGTIAYMAPEQMRGDEVDCRGDLYSLGVVLYEAVTGELPVGRFKLPGEMVEGTPNALDHLVDMLLAPQPAERPQNAREALAVTATASAASIVSKAPVGAAKRAEHLAVQTIGASRRSSAPDTLFPGLWGPAEAFPDIAELLQNGQWREAYDEAEALHKAGRDSATTVELLLFVSVLALPADNRGGPQLLDLAELAVAKLPQSGTALYLRAVARLMSLSSTDPSHEMQATMGLAVRDCQGLLAGDQRVPEWGLVSSALQGRGGPRHAVADARPVTILGYLLAALAAQQADARLTNLDQQAYEHRLRVLKQDIADGHFVDDPGLVVLGSWRGTAIERRLLEWLVSPPVQVLRAPGVGKLACQRYLIELMGGSDGEAPEFAQVVAEWSVAREVADTEIAGFWFDRAITTAWRYATSTPGRCTVLLGMDARLSSNEAPAEIFDPCGSPERPSEQGWKLGVFQSASRSCVCSLTRLLHKDSSTAFTVWEGGFTPDGRTLYPFAAMGDVVIKAGLLRRCLRVTTDDGHMVPDCGVWVWSENNVQILSAALTEWRRKWNHIADG